MDTISFCYFLVLLHVQVVPANNPCYSLSEIFAQQNDFYLPLRRQKLNHILKNVELHILMEQRAPHKTINYKSIASWWANYHEQTSKWVLLDLSKPPWLSAKFCDTSNVWWLGITKNDTGFSCFLISPHITCHVASRLRRVISFIIQ